MVILVDFFNERDYNKNIIFFWINLSTRVDKSEGITIEKNHFLPLYKQIKDDIKTEILSGQYQEGEKLPSENELVKTYDVTRTTIQRALDILVHDGLIEKIHGKGSFVRLKEVRENIWNFSGFSQFVKQTNQTAITKVITHDVFKENGINYLKLVRLRGIKKLNKIQWITLDSSVLSLKDFPGLEKIDFTEISLYETLEKKYQTIPHNARLNIEAIHSDETLKNFFELTSLTPLLNAKGDVVDLNGNIVEHVDVVYSPDAKFNFIANI